MISTFALGLSFPLRFFFSFHGSRYSSSHTHPSTGFLSPFRSCPHHIAVPRSGVVVMLRIARHSVYVYVRLGTISSFSVRLCSDATRMMIIYVSARSQMLLIASEEPRPPPWPPPHSAYIYVYLFSRLHQRCL